MDGVWGTVCDAGFGADEAQAVCRAINLTYDGSFLEGRSEGQNWNWRSNATGPTMPSVMSQASCPGGDSPPAESILDCDFTANPTDCSPYQDVQVTCNPGASAGFLSDPSEECLTSQQSPSGRQCSPGLRIGVCAPMGAGLFVRFNCGEDYGYLQQRSFEFHSNDGTPPPTNWMSHCNATAPSVQAQHVGVVFRGSDRCFADPDHAGEAMSSIKLQGCDASSDVIVIDGRQCNADCTVCLHNASAADWPSFTYDATQVGTCQTRFVNETLTDDTSTRRIDFTIDAFLCPGTLSPTSTPTTPTTSRPTSAPTTAPTMSRPTASPTSAPTSAPTRSRPTASPTSAPTSTPTASPTTFSYATNELVEGIER